MKKGLLFLAVCIAIVFFVIKPIFFDNKGFDKVITNSKLEKAINISELSTAEFVYNGIGEKTNDRDPSKIDCYIAYDANVKVGINMEDVSFEIDDENKTVIPTLPEININIATLDEKSISYIPANPNISLKEVIAICKLDAMKEANKSDKLYMTAKENLQSVIEALLSPLLEDSGYTIKWES